MIVLILALVLIVGFLGVIFWLVLRSDSNAGPTLGTNNPYPDGVGILGPGEDEPPYLPAPVISDRELFLRDADRMLADLHSRPHQPPPKSWMEEPGAMEAAGLVDWDDPLSEEPANPPGSGPPPQRSDPWRTA